MFSCAFWTGWTRCTLYRLYRFGDVEFFIVGIPYRPTKKIEECHSYKYHKNENSDREESVLDVHVKNF